MRMAVQTARHRADVRGARARRRVVGSSSYINVDGPNRRLEIGHTWYAASARRTGVNTETKLLMLGHAFENWVVSQSNSARTTSTQASRAAIERLGAKLDGMLRSHQLLPDGSRRDTVVYSILDIEWPAVRNNLEFRLARTLTPSCGQIAIPRVPRLPADSIGRRLARVDSGRLDRPLRSRVGDVDLAWLGALGERNRHGRARRSHRSPRSPKLSTPSPSDSCLR